MLLVTVHPPPLPALPAHHPRSHSCPPARPLLQRSPLYWQSIPLTRYLAPHGRLWLTRPHTQATRAALTPPNTTATQLFAFSLHTTLALYTLVHLQLSLTPTCTPNYHTPAPPHCSSAYRAHPSAKTQHYPLHSTTNHRRPNLIPTLGPPSPSFHRLEPWLRSQPVIVNCTARLSSPALDNPQRHATSRPLDASFDTLISVCAQVRRASCRPPLAGRTLLIAVITVAWRLPLATQFV